MPEYGLKIAEDFKQYLKTGDESLIEAYSIKELKTALKLLSPHYNPNELWFRAIEWRIDGLRHLESRKLAVLKRWKNEFLTKWTEKIIIFVFGLLCGILLIGM